MTVWIAKAAVWLKEHSVAALSGLSAILAAWIAWGSYKSDVAALKAQVELQTAKASVAAADAKADSHEQAAGVAGERADVAQDAVARETAKAVGARAEVQELSHDEVVDRLNRIRARNRRHGDSRS